MIKKAEAAARKLLAETLSTTVRQVPKEARFDSFERWDSLIHMRLVLSLEEELERSLETAEILSIESLSDVAEILSKKK